MLRRLSWIALALPVAWATWLVFQFSVNLPEWDAWPTTAKPLLRWLDGKLTFSDLNEQLVSTRLLIPRLFHLGLARLTGWNVRAECLLCVLASVPVLALLVLVLRRTFPDRPGRVWLLGMLFALALFSPDRSPVWLFPSLLCYSLTNVALAAMAWVFVSRAGPAGRTGLGIAAVAGACLCYVSGWPAWGLLGWFLFGDWVNGRLTRKQLVVAAVVSVLAMGALAATYFPGFRVGGATEVNHRVTFVGYIWFLLEWLAAPFAMLRPGLDREAVLHAEKVISHVLGPVALATWLWLAWAGLRKPGLRPRAWLWIGLGGYGLVGGVMVAIGRASLDPLSAFWPRYLALSFWFWASLAVLASLVWNRKALAGLVMLWPMAVAHLDGLRDMRADFLTSKMNHAALQFIRVAPEPALLESLLPDSGSELFVLAEAIDRHGFLRPRLMGSPRVEEARLVRDDRYEGALDDGDNSGPEVTLKGWALDHETRGPVDAIAISLQPEGGEETWYGVAAKRTKGKQARKSWDKRDPMVRVGWVFETKVPEGLAPRRPLPPGTLIFRAYVFDTVRQQFIKLPGQFRR